MATKRDAIKDAFTEMTRAVEQWVSDGTLSSGSPQAQQAAELTRNARTLLDRAKAGRKKYDPATDGPPRWSPQPRPDDTAASEAEFNAQAEAYRAHLNTAGLRDPETGGNTRAYTGPPSRTGG